MKKPYTNPAIYGIYFIVTGVIVYYLFFGGYQNAANPVPLSIIYIGILAYTSFYFLRPLYPVSIENGKLILYINFLYKKTIEIKTISSVEKFNRYDRLVISRVGGKKTNLTFLLRTDELVKQLKKQISKKGK